MNTPESRRDPRFPISRRGELSYKGSRFPCLIQDISFRGLLVICARYPVAGPELGLTFELESQKMYRCKIIIRHVDNGCLGSEIIEVGQHEDKIYQQFIQKHFGGWQDQSRSSLVN